MRGKWCTPPSKTASASGSSVAHSMAIMTALAWVLDRAKAVPNLFVDVSEAEASEAATLKPEPA